MASEWDLEGRVDVPGTAGSPRPMTRIQVGGGVGVAVWRNTGTGRDGAPTEWYSVTLQRAYKAEGRDEWQYTGSLRVKDLLPAALALQEAYRQLAAKSYDRGVESEAETRRAKGGVDEDELPF